MTHDALTARLNKNVSRLARVVFEGEANFGPALRLSRWRLGNGLEVILLPDQSAPVVAYHTWYRVGSRHEEPGKTGLAHFFEHMMFNETKNLAWGEFDRRMEEAGGETNAATWVDWTYYYEALPADELALAIELEADRMTNLLVRKPQVESEREVVANERRMAVEDDVHGRADETLHALAFGRAHPHGWPTIGWMDDILAYRVADCREFYRTWYAPNNATVVVVGQLDQAETLGLIQHHYGAIRPSKLPSRDSVPRPSQRAPRRASFAWPTPSPKVGLGWHAPAYTHPDYAVAEVIDELLTGGRSARLRRRLVEELEIVSELRGGVAGLRHGGLFDLWISMREGHAVDEALRVVEEEFARLRDTPVSAQELEKVKNRAELFTLSEIETVGGKANQLGYGRAVADDPLHAFTALEAHRRVTSDDVRRVATTMLTDARRSRVDVVVEDAVAEDAA